MRRLRLGRWARLVAAGALAWAAVGTATLSGREGAAGADAPPPVAPAPVVPAPVAPPGPAAPAAPSSPAVPPSPAAPPSPALPGVPSDPAAPSRPAPPAAAAPSAAPVVRYTLDKAASKGLVTASGEQPSSYAQVDLVLTNRTDEPLHLDLAGHHLRPTTSGCQRLGLSHPVTPGDRPPTTPPGTWPFELAPRETKHVRMNTCCMDAGRPCPRGTDRFELASAPTPPTVEAALRWWTDHPAAPQGFVNSSIWQNDLRLLERPFARTGGDGRSEPIGPKGRRIRSHGGIVYTLVDGVLTSVDADGVRRFHATEIWDVLPRADALYGIGTGADGNDLWRFAATGEPPWGKVFPLGRTERLLDLVPAVGGGFFTRTAEGVLEWRSAKDAAPTVAVAAEKSTRFTFGPVDAAKGRFVAVVHQKGTPKAGVESVGTGALSASSPKFAVMDVDGRTGASRLRKLYWNVRDMAAGPGGVFALSPVGSPERLDGEKLYRLPGTEEYDAIVLVGATHLVLRTKENALVALDVKSGKTSPLPPEASHTAFGDELSIDPVTDDVVWVGKHDWLRWRFGAASVEVIP